MAYPIYTVGLFRPFSRIQKRADFSPAYIRFFKSFEQNSPGR